jgi:hypothetical protein
MAEETTPSTYSISEMIRITNENTNMFYNQIADHIDQLEKVIAELTAELNELKGTTNADN